MTANAGEGVEKEEFLYTAAGCKLGSHCIRASQNLKLELLLNDPAVCHS